MGTSVNQRSPDTTPWKFVQQAYDDPNVPLDRALNLIWRAADLEQETRLTNLLGQPIIGSVAAVVGSAQSPSQAARDAVRLIVTNKASSLAADIARRAVVQSVGQEDAPQAFARRLFAEATNYLVARDLPGHVSKSGRAQNVADSLAFKQRIMDTAMAVVDRVPSPRALDAQGWSSYVTAVVSALKKRGG